MEMEILNNNNHVQHETIKPSRNNVFIEGNTLPVTLKEIQRDHVIPVFVKDNEPAISHAEFIEIVSQSVEDAFGAQESSPIIRVSHPIKGRVPEARAKRAADLEEHEKTLYFERLAFIMELSNVHQIIDGNLLKLTVGGVKAYSEDNFSNNKGVDEHFKVFIGFKNTVCTNLCVNTSGLSDNITARSNEELYHKVAELIRRYNAVAHINELQRFSNLSLSESEFAHLIGRCRLYNYLPVEEKQLIPQLKLNDTIIGKVAEQFYRDPNFRIVNNQVSLWRLFNLFTGANKGSYIDTFLSRNANAHDFTRSLADAIEEKQSSWFLN